MGASSRIGGESHASMKNRVGGRCGGMPPAEGVAAYLTPYPLSLRDIPLSHLHCGEGRGGKLGEMGEVRRAPLCGAACAPQRPSPCEGDDASQWRVR